MEIINKLEKLVLGWAKNVPHLPITVQKWLGLNVWWMALVGAIMSGIAFLIALANVFTLISLLNAASSLYYVAGNYTANAVLLAIIGLIFITANGVLLGLAVKPLQEIQKKGWVLLFLTLLLDALSIIVNAVLSFSVAGFIVQILFGAIMLAIGAYFIAEIHSQFGHRAKKTTKTA